MPGLGRRIQFDERSKAFPIRALLEDKKPRSYSWKVNVWLDQGETSSCVGHAWAHELCARPVVSIVDQPYAMRIYTEAQKVDEWPGEDYEGTSVLAGVKVCTAWGHYGSYRWCFGLNDLVLALGYAGPVVLGINWHEQMFEPDSNGRIQPSGQVVGGHAILAHAVQVKTTKRPIPQIWLWNSWGRAWGRDGRAWLSWDDMTTLLADAGEACVPQARSLPHVVEHKPS
jgi:hypothetical protein